jgi:hypothetical protein
VKGVYLLDACNIVREGSQGAWRDDDAESRRWVACLERKIEPAPRLRVVAVFDGPRRYRAAGGFLELRFAEGTTADAVILDLARGSLHEGRSVYVVSWDGALVARALEEGARTLTPAEFERRLSMKRA